MSLFFFCVSDSSFLGLRALGLLGFLTAFFFGLALAFALVLGFALGLALALAPVSVAVVLVVIVFFTVVAAGFLAVPFCALVVRPVCALGRETALVVVVA